MSDSDQPTGIAIIGMACRLPGADSPGEFWRNLCGGVESIRFFSEQELLEGGVPAHLLADPRYIRAAPVLNEPDRFDAAFFDYSPREAALIDPQHRLFLEVAWEAFEDAGYDPREHEAAVGVFAGGGGVVTSYLLAHHDHPGLPGQTGSLEHIANDKDYLSTRISYKLNLTGPSITVQTACSTSLVATHLACQSLKNGECDVALAGASTVRIPHASGYLAEKGGIYSLDGHCRSFDARGTGTIFGSGVVAVLLKSVGDAVADGDHVYAVIKGTAVNNDGRRKVSYTAPSVLGQARAMVEAMAVAGVAPDTIGYVECHATGTKIGDPIEVDALTRAFRTQTDRTGYCALGSVKGNIGHPEQSAGLAGLIKTALVLKHGEIPPNIHLGDPNPQIDFAASPFYVRRRSIPWPERNGAPRRAGVNSLGIGGTNAFAVLEEAPRRRPPPEAGRAAHLLCLSAKSESALRGRARQLAAVLEKGGDDLADVCFTANVSRAGLAHRLSLLAHDRQGAARTLVRYAAGGSGHGTTGRRGEPGRTAFLFSGQGAQYPGMAGELYRTQPTFRAAFDECDALAEDELGESLIEVLRGEGSAEELARTGIAQPMLFAVEYALARMWHAWGIGADAVLGHSVGELAAACYAGVFDLADAMRLVVGRAKLMQGLPRGGSMAVIFAGETEVCDALAAGGARGVEISAVNSPQNTVVSGPRPEVERLVRSLEERGATAKPLRVSHAFHSALMDPILDDLEALAGKLDAKAPRLPLISDLTGEPFTGAPPPSYWREQARHCVRFAAGAACLEDLGCSVFLEIGPGKGLLAMARQGRPASEALWLPSLDRRRGDWETVLESLRRLYLRGFAIDWRSVDEGWDHRRVPLPTYPFERRRHWLEPAGPREARPRPTTGPGLPRAPAARRDRASHSDSELRSWLYRQEWRRQDRPERSTDAAEPGPWLILADEGGLAGELEAALGARGYRCHLAFRASGTPRRGGPRRELEAEDRGAYPALLAELAAAEPQPFAGVVHAWAIDLPARDDMTLAEVVAAEVRAAGSALFLAQAISECGAFRNARVFFATRQAVPAGGGRPTVAVAQAPLLGLARSFALERPRNWGGAVDLPASGDPASVAERLADELSAPVPDHVALRDDGRYVARLVPWRPEAAPGPSAVFRADACYLITGGLGMIGLRTARWLVDEHGVRSLVLTGRSGPDSAAGAAVAELEAAGAEVRVIAADISREDDVRSLMESIDAAGPPLKGVIHCAGVLRDGILDQQDWEGFTAVTSPKIRGSWLLHQATKDRDLEVFALHSSLLSVTGGVGQSNYAAANAFLDALVDHRRRLGLPATAVNWGPWGEAGLATVSGRAGDKLWRRLGVSRIPPEVGIRVLSLAHDHGVDHLAVTRADWNIYAEALPAAAPMLSELVSNRGAAAVAAEPGAPAGVRDWERHLREAPASERRRLLRAALRARVTSELGFAEPIDVDRPLDELGLDSLMSVGLANRLETTMNLSIPVAKLIKGPSVAQLADLLLADLDLLSEEDSSAAAAPRRAAASTAAVSPGRWLIFPEPNPTAKARLFCFPYAGGGAMVYRSWARLLAPEIELVAVESPGHGGRIDEPPLRRVEAWVESFLPDLRPYLDKPSALFGHCMGGMSAYATTRELLRGETAVPVHLFIAGARPPHHIGRPGSFEEKLWNDLVRNPDFDPLVEPFEQQDDVFASMLHHFDIDATDEWLANPELRGLLLPTVRADFEMVSFYVPETEPPWTIPITYFAGLDDLYVSRRDSMAWSDYTRSSFKIHFLEATHFMVVENRDAIIAEINRELAEPARREPAVNEVPRAPGQARQPGSGRFTVATPPPAPIASRAQDPPLPDAGPRQLAASAAAFAALDEHCEHRVLAILRQMGTLRSPVERHTRGGLFERLGIVAQYEKLTSVLLEDLAAAGFVKLEGEEVLGTPGLASPGLARRLAGLDDERRRLAAAHPEIERHLELVARCAASYPGLLQGDLAPTDVMFPGGSTDLVQAAYRDHFTADWHNTLTARVVAARVEAALDLDGSPASVLEVGAGTGATTGHVLRELGRFRDRLRYFFTDVSPAFTRHGESLYGEHPFVAFALFDLEEDADQGFEPGSVDVILGSNVLHATRDVPKTLSRLEGLLRPGGSLVINELTRRRCWLSKTFGLLPGWWLAEDGENRLPGSPLLAPEKWRRLLIDVGFEDVRIQSQPSVPGREPSQHVIAAVRARLATVPLFDLREVGTEASRPLPTEGGSL